MERNDSSSSEVPPPLYPPPLPSARPVRPRNGWKNAAILLAVVLVGVLGLSMVGRVLRAFSGPTGLTQRVAGPQLEEVFLEHNHADQKIVVIPVEGIITSQALDGGGYSMVRHISDQLKRAAKDDDVRAVILKVDSPGGEVLASDDIANAIRKFQTKHHKPVIAAMGSLAASGGYYISAPCRWIVANELTITGSIGVIMHGYNYRGLMNKVGLQPQVFKSGRFKDMLSGEKDLEKMTPQERADVDEETRMVQTMINQTFDKFKKVVDDGRKEANQLNGSNEDKGRPLNKTWQSYADGRVLSGKDALELGFVDELGGFETAVARAKQLAKIEAADLVTYQPLFDWANVFRMFGQSESRALKVDLGLPATKLQSGQLYFLWPYAVR